MTKSCRRYDENNLGVFMVQSGSPGGLKCTIKQACSTVVNAQANSAFYPFRTCKWKWRYDPISMTESGKAYLCTADMRAPEYDSPLLVIN